MPSSILINDGRRSASPDRRVTFGNIERYDIMTSNEIKNNMFVRGSGNNVSTVNGNYPMTRLDNRIRKAVMLGFTHAIGDSVAYEEIIDFLLEFDVIVNPKVCNERQITAIIQSSFPKCIVKSSVRHSVVYFNLENRSDEVVKEELVRVTTEPIINSYDSATAEAHAWIKEEHEGPESDEDEDEELTLIEEKTKEEKSNSNLTTSMVFIPRKESKIPFSATPTESSVKPDSDISYISNGSYENDINTRRRSIEKITVKGARADETSAPIKERGYDMKIEDYDEKEVDVKPMREYIVERSTPIKDHLSHLSQIGTPVNDQLSRSTPIRDQLSRSTPIRDQLSRNTPPMRAHISEKSALNQDNSSLTRNTSSPIRDRVDSYPAMIHKGNSNSPIRERAIDVPDNAVQSKSKNETGVSNGMHKAEKQVTLKKTGSFSNQGQSSVADVTKKFELKTPDSPSKSSLQRKRSFTRSTDRSFVGSIRDRFRINKSKQTDDEEKELKNRKGEEKKEKKVKKDEVTKKNSIVGTSIATLTPTSVRKNIDTNKQTKIPTTSETRNTVRTSSIRKSQGMGGSCVDVRSSFRNKPENERGLTRNGTNSSSVTDIRSSFRNNSARSSINRLSHNLIKEENAVSRSPSLQRANSPLKISQHTDTRASLRRSSPDKQTTRAEVSTRGSTNRSSYRAANMPGSSFLPGSNRSSFRNSKPPSTTGVKRTNSRKGISSKGSSETSSTSSTPSMSRENSKTNLKITAKKTTKLSSPQEKDLVKIAKAFQRATKEVDTAKDRIERFMIGIATDDLEEAPNERLKLDDLYDHIRHRMILAKDTIFENRRTNVTVDMSQYFELLFKTLASHFDRVGCEMVTDKQTKEITCFLTHVKLVDYVDDLGDLTQASIEEEDESPRASYV